MRARGVPDLPSDDARSSGDGPLRRDVRIPSARWRACKATSVPGFWGCRPPRSTSKPCSGGDRLRAYRAAYLVVHDGAAAEDIAQESFLAAIRALDRFDRRRPFAPWLHRIVVNRAIDWARARALRAEVGDRRSPRSPKKPPGEHVLLSGGGRAQLSPEHRRDRPAPPARVHARRDRRIARAHGAR